MFAVVRQTVCRHHSGAQKNLKKTERIVRRKKFIFSNKVYNAVCKTFWRRCKSTCKDRSISPSIPEKVITDSNFFGKLLKKCTNVSIKLLSMCPSRLGNLSHQLGTDTLNFEDRNVRSILKCSRKKKKKIVPIKIYIAGLLSQYVLSKRTAETERKLVLPIRKKSRKVGKITFRFFDQEINHMLVFA